ncbi:hypothetical protein EYF80_012954 [Liparis tanakae]|uniref:Uncharacterized protein n=1 Tax=Liparis tanakae TaxID=230148 RepID=A0A4Z2IGQ5_9TELE|nr:hypothetical protein EYF80_012954 [Liparis tanakae]
MQEVALLVVELHDGGGEHAEAGAGQDQTQTSTPAEGERERWGRCVTTDLCDNSQLSKPSCSRDARAVMIMKVSSPPRRPISPTAGQSARQVATAMPAIV